MSVSISGVKLAINDIFELDAKLIEWREVVRKLAREKLTGFYAQEVTAMIDDACGKNEEMPPTSNILNEIYEDIRNRQRKIKASGERDPRIDFDFTIHLYPFEGEVYGITNTEQSDWTKKFRRLPFVSDFSYWNNSDPDRRVKAKDWQHRAHVWMNLFKDHSTYRSRGFTIECGPDETHQSAVSRSDIVKKIVPFEDRLKRVATNRIIYRQMEMTKTDSFAKSWASTFIHLYHDWLPTAGAQAMLAIEMGHLSSILPKAITADML